jgi:hypothetical protein
MNSLREGLEEYLGKRCLESVGGVQRRSEAVDDGAQRSAVYGLCPIQGGQLG